MKMRTEQAVLTLLANLGYIITDNDCSFFRMEQKVSKKIIVANKTTQTLCCFKHCIRPYATFFQNDIAETKYYKVEEPCLLDFIEIELLQELFKIWKWEGWIK